MSTDATLDQLNDARTATATSTTKKKSLTRFVPVAARVLLGLVFFVFGLDYFLHFMPAPKGPFPAGAMALGGAMMQSGYLFELIKGTEVLCGALLLCNVFTPLALVVLAPVVVNIFCFHAFLEPAGIPMAAIIVALTAYLGWAYRDTFRPLLALRAKPAR
jgi:uncharacterized membrane protein YphA (DoxX/SURF4 family)